MVIDDGTYRMAFDIPSEKPQITIKAANVGKVVLDGQGGVGANHRLAFGKGIIHCRSTNCTFIGLRFLGGGGADGAADGEAGLYIDNPAQGSFLVRKCSFDNCENGIFINDQNDDAGHNVTILLEDCHFGQDFSNGQSKDGLSHDVYLRGVQASVTRCTFYGNKYGNLIKSYAKELTVTDSWFSHGAGRWLDLNHGGKLMVSNCHVEQDEGANNQMVSYAVQNVQSGAGPATIGQSEFVLSRFDTQVWVAAGSKVVFDPTCTWAFGKRDTKPAPTIRATVAGTVDGLPDNPAVVALLPDNLPKPPDRF
jgi:hypothetical protein